MQAEAFRLEPGADLKQELERFVRGNGWRSPFILSCVGSLSRAVLRMPGAQPDGQVVTTFDEPMEILSVVGTLARDGAHIHITLGRENTDCVGGHVADGCCVVRTTAELVVGELSHLE